jgi:hypothetical protein
MIIVEMYNKSPNVLKNTPKGSDHKCGRFQKLTVFGSAVGGAKVNLFLNNTFQLLQ